MPPFPLKLYCNEINGEDGELCGMAWYRFRDYVTGHPVTLIPTGLDHTGTLGMQVVGPRRHADRFDRRGFCD